MEIVILAIGVVCAGVFVHTFLTLESHAKQPVRIPVELIAGGRAKAKPAVMGCRHQSIE